jgi:restriction endonuclease fold toxin 2 of polymorphic toxin system
VRSQAPDLAVDLPTLFTGSVQFQDHRLWAAQIRNELVNKLSGTGSMAGADDHGQQFGKQYDPAANSVLDALGRAAQGLGQIGYGLLSMQTNYLRADVASDAFNPNLPLPATTDECQEQSVSVPSAIGESGRSSIPVLDRYWPQGDTARLRQAAVAWTAAAAAIGNLKVAADRTANLITSSNQGQGIDAFSAYWGRFSGSHGGAKSASPLLDHLQDASTKIAKALNWHADQIDNLRDSIQGLAVTAGIATVIGVGLTIFTLGASDAAVVVVDGGIAADAIVLVADFTAAEAASAEIASLVEIPELAQVAAAAIPFVLPLSTNVTNVTAPLGLDASFQIPTGVPQAVPPLPTPGFDLLSPADEAAALAWMAGLPQGPIRGSAPGDPEYAYQVRVAGETEYYMQGTNGSIWADGFRPADGAIIDAKYVNKPNLSCWRVGNANQRPSYVYENIMAQAAAQIRKYAGVLANPNNKARFLEIVTNDPLAAPYFEALLLLYGVPGRVRVVP